MRVLAAWSREDLIENARLVTSELVTNAIKATCPQLAPHPPGRTGRLTTRLDWTAERPHRARVLDYTCSCRTIVYELLASGGTYVIRRTHQTAPPRETYAGPWTRREADRTWTLILTEMRTYVVTAWEVSLECWLTTESGRPLHQGAC
ncbi:hypothetical protein [Nonomuraea cavernae]|uniref:hypothetical protein n=1 Tax=Nonomuraea cavernae TaxID=2045107 RepID=UPI0033C89246